MPPAVAAAIASHMSVRAVMTTRSGEGEAQLVARAFMNEFRSASGVTVTSSSAWSMTTSSRLSALTLPPALIRRTYSLIPPGVRINSWHSSTSMSAS